MWKLRTIAILAGMLWLGGELTVFGHLPILDLAAAQSHGAKAGTEEGSSEDKKEISPEEKMARRFPQPVRVGDLIGLPVLDKQDSTLGFVTQVVRTPAGKIQLIVPYRRWFGWIRPGGEFTWGRRPVAVPIETVAILAREIDALDMPREDFDTAPTFEAAQATRLKPDDSIKIAVARR